MGHTWYIDSTNGTNQANGLSEQTPRLNWNGISIEPGDTVLLHRGSLFRSSIISPDGMPSAPIVWGAYGEGVNPIICGSINCSCAQNWNQVSNCIWEAVGLPQDEVCNLIFNYGASFGTLRWTPEELQNTGDWYFSHYGVEGIIPTCASPQLLVYAPQNPATYWQNIEVAVFGKRWLVRAYHDVVFQDITFLNGGVHGFATIDSARISILRCRFENIGGCVWSKEQKIRFGNGVEFWNSAYDNRVEDCIFHQIYDSAVTHQGCGEYPVPERLFFRGNRFTCCGMASYEIRDVIPRQTVFSYNYCSEGGMGFSSQGEIRPRRSEIWPQPMGHHLFVWRIKSPTRLGEIRVEHNTFGSVPFGSAEYSIVSPESEAQIHFYKNIFHTGKPEQALYRNGKYIKIEGIN